MHKSYLSSNSRANFTLAIEIAEMLLKDAIDTNKPQETIDGYQKLLNESKAKLKELEDYVNKENSKNPLNPHNNNFNARND